MKIKINLFDVDYKVAIFVIMTVTVAIIGCSTPPVERNYYIIDYAPIAQNPKLVLNQPLPYRVEVSNSRIARIYDRSQLVFRYSHHRVEYSNNDLWAVRLSASIPDAITNHLVQYNTFATTQRDFLIEKPQYEVITTVNQIEMLQSDYFFGAKISMDIFLRQTSDVEYVVRHSFNREEELFTDNVEMFVQQVSKVLKGEMDVFVEKVLRHFDKLSDDDVIEEEADEKKVTKEGVEITTEPSERLFGLTEQQISTWLMPSPHEQLIKESKRDLVGMGRLFLPAMSNPDSEPFYILYNPEENINYFETMGASVYLKPGHYTLQYGSGADIQKMSKELTIQRDETIIIEPDWGGLRIRLIDENRNTIDDQYELFAVSNAESYGYGQGVIEEFGEKLYTWILNQGTYKIVLNNYPFNTLEDFTTVDVVQGELRTVTIVIDSDTKKMKGAGILEELDHSMLEKDWRFSSTLHGSFNLNWDNSVDKDNPSTTFIINSQFDNRLVFDKYPYYFTTHNLTDLGFSKEKEQDFRISADSFKLRNTFVYYLSNVIGVYTRGDVETHFFEEYIYSSETKNYRKEKGNKFTNYLEKESLQVKPSLFPLVFREGIGLNIRALNKPRASLNFRFGFGLRQDIYNEVYRFDRTATEIDTLTQKTTVYDVYQQIESSYREGTEISILANLHFPFNVSYNTTADILVPFAKSESYSYNWENIFTIRLIRQIAIDYKINLAYNKDIRDYTEVIQNVFLRLTYTLY